MIFVEIFLFINRYDFGFLYYNSKFSSTQYLIDTFHDTFPSFRVTLLTVFLPFYHKYINYNTHEVSHNLSFIMNTPLYYADDKHWRLVMVPTDWFQFCCQLKYQIWISLSEDDGSGLVSISLFSKRIFNNAESCFVRGLWQSCWACRHASEC